MPVAASPAAMSPKSPDNPGAPPNLGRRRFHSGGIGATARVVQNHFPPKDHQGLAEIPDFVPSPAAATSALAARNPIVIRPSGRPGFSAPKAATFFLGKDHERWRRYDRDRLSGFLSWERVASAVSSRGEHRGSRGAFSSFSSESDEDYSDSGTSCRSSRSRSSRLSSGGRSRRPSDATTPPMTPHDSTSGARPRRFSSNGPEAAFLRHETVIGIHTPRRRSSASEHHPALRPLAQIRPPSGQSSKVAVPLSDRERTEREKKQKTTDSRQDEPQRRTRPSRKEKKKSTSSRQKEELKEVAKRKKTEPRLATLDLDEAARPSIRRLRSNLEAAAAAAAATSDVDAQGADEFDEVSELHVSLSDAALDGKGPLSASDLQSLLPLKRESSPRSPLVRTASPRAPPLQLARRKKPQPVEGTLYDETGPYREGAVTDGLSVRLFSTEDPARTSSFDDADLSNSEHPVTKPWGRRGSSSSYDEDVDDQDAVYMQSSPGRRRPKSLDGEEHRPSPRSSFSEATASAVASEYDSGAASSSEPPMVYLITTPDNRVSSAAKLRRWAMDSHGHFYAAMEIKSIEAKLKAADPTSGRVTKDLVDELRETYLEDILDEVQKAETLNPSRTGAVSKLLKTEDDRYVRLEEDYPEEAFFVIAGCEEDELYGVIANIYVQAIRMIAHFHASGWMHGDIKLENLMFDENGELVVIDYENANPYRGIAGGDGQVQLVSYDWIPPEAQPGPYGRRMGPSGDLWALGCNLIRAFALRDGIEDLAIREALLGSGQKAFLDYVKRHTTKTIPPPSQTSLEPPSIVTATDYLSAKASEQAGSSMTDWQPMDAFVYHVDLEPILNGSAEEDVHQHSQIGDSHVSVVSQSDAFNSKAESAESGNVSRGASCCDSCSSATSQSASGATSGAPTPDTSIDPSASSSGVNSPYACSREGSDAGAAASYHHSAQQGPPTPSRLLYRFARSAPELLTWVLSRCVVRSVDQRNFAEAESEGLRLASWFEFHHKDLVEKGRAAVDTAIEMSGSIWVRPRLDDARKSLGLE
ncbi:hypothetical protein BCV70DRAFT_214681 [Testicularia cyperi]|uniref:Protein kinase domain-containing protein n=1 Tax=Testicularia cyperi TaxID=1882483 RepID=A0A317XY46_9BASI|nr:hypothetical protein BCV70DRAFT_214681 [Testicularia cyperi]